ncbi:hypothetical protein AN958_01386 [Leucoagaricus sp. SymC.cos]|nr:hypothetical protein AN958_01386 [Leucoagaricus sp. SymC.cos]
MQATSPYQDEIALLETKTRQLDSEIEKLMVQRAAYQRQINGMQAATAKLPSEILSAVFQDCSRSRKRLLTLGAVCSQWRAVAWSTPKLWNECDLYFSWQEVFRWQVDALKLWFNNCQPFGLSLSLWFAKETDDEEEAYHWLEDDPSPEVASDEEFLDMVFKENPQNLCALTINYFPSGWRSRLVDCLLAGKLTNIRTLDATNFTYSADLAGIQEADPSGTPSLTKLILRCDPIDQSFGEKTFDAFPLSHLTSLELYGVESKTALDLLLQLSNLRSFACRRLPSSHIAHIQNRDVIELPNLLELEWDFHNDEWTLFLLNNVRLPSLRRLFWNYHWQPEWDGWSHHLPPPNNLVVNFLSSLSKLKVFLGASNIFWLHPTQNGLLAALSQGLEELHLLELDEVLSYDDFTDVLEFLTLRDQNSHEYLYSHKPPRWNFPHLKKLVFDTSCVKDLYSDRDEDDFDPLCSMIESRKNDAVEEAGDGNNDSERLCRKPHLEVMQFKAYSLNGWNRLSRLFNAFQEDFEDLETEGVSIEAEKANGEIWPWYYFV